MRFCSSIARTSARKPSPTLNALRRSAPRGVPVSLAGTRPRPPAKRTNTPKLSILSTVDVDDVARLRGRRRGGAGRLLARRRRDRLRPRGERLHREADPLALLRVLVDAEHLDLHGVAGREQILRLRHAIPGQLGDVDEPLDAPDVHERAVVLHARHDALEAPRRARAARASRAPSRRAPPRGARGGKGRSRARRRAAP